MPTRTVAAGKVGVHGVTLTANEVESVEFADNLGTVSIVVTSPGSAPVYFTVNGDDPDPDDGNCYVIPGGVTGEATIGTLSTDSDTVKLLSAGTPTVSVTRGY